MMEIFLLYLFTRIPAIQVLLFSITALAFMIGVVKALSADGDYHLNDAQRAPLFKDARRWMMWAILPGILWGLIPSKSDVGIILAGTAVIEAAKSETAGRLASKSVQLIEQTLDGLIKQKE